MVADRFRLRLSDGECARILRTLFHDIRPNIKHIDKTATTDIGLLSCMKEIVSVVAAMSATVKYMEDKSKEQA